MRRVVRTIRSVGNRMVAKPAQACKSLRPSDLARQSGQLSQLASVLRDVTATVD